METVQHIMCFNQQEEAISIPDAPVLKRGMQRDYRGVEETPKRNK